MPTARLLSLEETKCLKGYKEPFGPSKVLQGRCCWISPEGRFYHCDFGEHWNTSYKIVGSLYPNRRGDAEGVLERAGFCKVGRSYGRDGLGFIYRTKDLRITQAQLDVLYDLTNLGTTDFRRGLRDSIQWHIDNGNVA